MSVRPRAVILAALACIPLALVSACGGANGSAAGPRSTLQYVPATSYVVKEPATTTTTTTTIAIATSPEDARSPGEQTYKIKGGDSLFGIASRYDVTMELICDYNGWAQCGSEKLLLPGDEILIPPNAAVASADGEIAGDDSIDTPDDGAAATEGEGCLHTVVANDIPIRVAKKYEITVEELAAANASNPIWNNFRLGGTLNIPANGAC